MHCALVFFSQYVIIIIMLIKTMWVCIVHYTLHPSHVTERFCMCSGNFYRALDLAQWLHHGGHCSYTAFVVPNHLVGFHSNDRCFFSEVWSLHLKRRRGGRLQNTKNVILFSVKDLYTFHIFSYFESLYRALLLRKLNKV